MIEKHEKETFTGPCLKAPSQACGQWKPAQMLGYTEVLFECSFR